MRAGLKDQVLQLYRDRPTATSQEIADILDCGSAYVRSTLKRAGLPLYRSHGSKNCKALKVTVSGAFVEALEPHAEKRGCSVLQLVDRLIGVIATENVVDAVLDDEVHA